MDIDEIMSLIDWKRSDEEQQKGISAARGVSCIKAFFRPVGSSYSKSVWDNCAIIICERGDEELEPYIFDMLLWLEDLNWPGAETIQHRLMRFEKVDVLALCLNTIAPALEQLNKSTWLMYLAKLLHNDALKSKLNSDGLRVLSAYCNSTD